MRINIEIDDKLMAKVMKGGDFRTKREAVDAALRTLLRMQSQRAIIKYRGKLKWEGDLDAIDDRRRHVRLGRVFQRSRLEPGG